MTSSSLHVQWPLTSQSHGSFLIENTFFTTDQTPCPQFFLFENLATLLSCKKIDYESMRGKSRRIFTTNSFLARWFFSRRQSRDRELQPGAGLPDGLFSNRRSQFGYNWEGLCNGRCCSILWQFWCVLWSFCIHVIWGHLVYNFPFWYVVPRKIWQSWPGFSAGASPTIVSYNASAVKVYNATSSLVRFGNKGSR
jgi:hypothetical protein